jgi:hypothetical protein
MRGAALFALILAFVLLSSGGPLRTGTTNAAIGSVLIYGPSLNGVPDNEHTLAVAAGYTVTVADAATWSGMTTAQFASYDAIVFGDPTCVNNDTSPLAAADANKAVWSAAVTGRITLNGADAVTHGNQGVAAANVFTTNSIKFAADGTGTGLYVSLSCYYGVASSGTPVSFLSAVGSFEVAGNNDNCVVYDTVIVLEPGHPVMAGLTSANKSGWYCIPHQVFTSYPASYTPLAIDVFTDLPFVLALGAVSAPTPPPPSLGGLARSPDLQSAGDAAALTALAAGATTLAALAVAAWYVRRRLRS